jgi:hypothetical protein
MSTAATGIEIFVFKGSRFLGSRCFSQPTIVIGRGREAALKLQGGDVADRHAIVRLEGGDLVIADATGAGLVVNGQPIRVCRLSSVDEVSVGPFRLKMSILGQEEDQGFSAGESDPGPGPAREEEEQDTFVQRADEIMDNQREDVTVPKISRSDFDEELETHAATPSGRRAAAAFSARDRLDPARPRRDDYGDEPLFPERRERPLADDAEQEFAPQQATTRKADHPFARPRGTEAPPRESQRRAEQARQAEDARRAEETRKTEEERRAEARRSVESKRAQAAETVSQLRATGEEEAQDEEPASPPGLEEPFAGELHAEGDEDVDEEEVWVEPFSLLENIVRERFKTPVASDPYAMIEAIHYHGNVLADLRRANPGESIEIGYDRYNLITLEPDGRALLYFQKDFSGTLVAKGKARPLKAFCKDNYLVDRERGLYAVVLQEGDYAQVLHGASGFLVRFVKPPTMPRSKTKLSFGFSTVQPLFASVAFHFLLAVLMGVVSSEGGLKVENESERFAKVALTDVNLEKLKEETKVEQKKQEEPKVDKPKDIPKETPKVVKKVAKQIVKSNVPLTTKQKERVQRKQVANVLSALENLKPAGAAPGRSDLKALASNISAVRVPGGGSAANFKVSGVIGKGVGDGVRLAGGIGGGGGKDTRVGSQLLSGGSKIGNLSALAGTGSRAPRARVSKPPTREVRMSGGTLSREAIQQVVSQHMHEVQACYERQLLSSPGLAGKIVFDWVIEMGGGVSSARQASSSMKNAQVSMCVLGLIRTWRFPSPVGGSVQVRYPFVFRVQGF